MSAYQVIARNFSTSSENRMHSDEMASRYGFRGALVPGVAIYGHLVKPFVDRFGASWLGDSCLEVKLIKPSYHGDQLTIEWSDANQGVAATNQHGELVAILASQTMTELPEDLGLEGELKVPGRPEISWDNVCVGEVFSPRALKLSGQENKRYADEIGDDDALYRTHIHPHYLLSLANEALMQEYIMPAWIHVKSKITHRSALRVGNEVIVRSVVTDRWERKGHQFIAFHLTFWHNECVAVDIEHHAIFRIAE
jgi:hypothetical protein